MGNSLALQSICCEALTNGPACRILHRLSRPALWRHRFPHVDCALSCGDSKRGCVAPNVRFGSKADICSAKRDVRFTPNSDHESDFSQKPMSALPPKADVCSALVYVR
jgi:hypothetical protein